MKIWNPQYQTLDHWRGLAALWVMLFHGFEHSSGQTLFPLIEPLQSIAKPGWLGVHIFFVISGYCISASAYKLIIRNDSVGNFIKNRALRLLPVYWLAFLFTVVTDLISARLNNRHLWENLPDSWQSWLGNILLIQPYLNVRPYVIVYWTLVVEIAFYLLVAVLLITKKLTNTRVALLLGLSLGFASPFINLESIEFLSLWGEFVCGALLFCALLFKYNKNSYKQKISLWLIIFMAFTSIISIIFNQQYNQLWLASIFSLLLYFLYALDSQISKIRQLRWLGLVGTFSYSLYLLHVPFQARVLGLGARFVSQNSISYLFLQIAGWILAILVSYGFYYFAEQPFNDWRYQYLSSTSRRNIKYTN